MHFCNQNGVPQVLMVKPTAGPVLPFGLQKVIKNKKFSTTDKIFEKYGAWAFQNLSQNVSTTSSYDFIAIWSLVKTAKK